VKEHTVNKAELLERMETGRAEWERVLVQIAEPNMIAPLLANGWSVKDVVAHVMAYERWTAAQIRAALRGTEPTTRELYDTDDVPPGVDTPDTDARNVAFQAYYRDTSLAEIMAGSQRAFDELADMVRETPEEQLADPTLSPWLGGVSWLDLLPQQSYQHYEQHLPDLRELVKRIEDPESRSEPGSGAARADR
jgi:hypothetical protein